MVQVVSVVLPLIVIVASASWRSPLEVLVSGLVSALSLLGVARWQRSRFALLSALIALSVAMLHWPLRLTFWVTKERLEILASSAERGARQTANIFLHDVSA